MVFRYNASPVLRSHCSSSMAIAVLWGPSMAINGPSMGIDEVFLMMIPSMGIEIFHHKNSFDLAIFKISTKLSPYKFFSLFRLCWGFYLNLPNIYCKLDIFNPKMLQSAPMRWAIIQIPSMAIDGQSMPIRKSCDGSVRAVYVATNNRTVLNSLSTAKLINQEKDSVFSRCFLRNRKYLTLVSPDHRLHTGRCRNCRIP